jgi:hypothetical protein
MKVGPNPFHFEMPNVASGNVGEANDTGYRMAVRFNL